MYETNFCDVLGRFNFVVKMVHTWHFQDSDVKKIYLKSQQRIIIWVQLIIWPKMKRKLSFGLPISFALLDRWWCMLVCAREHIYNHHTQNKSNNFEWRQEIIFDRISYSTTKKKKYNTFYNLMHRIYFI